MTSAPDAPDSSDQGSNVPTDSVRVFISGFVQGVSFRRWVEGEALDRGINGWVRNLRDGRVEALFHGDARAVSDLVRACRHGPARARLDSEHRETAPNDGLPGFRIVDSE